MLRKSVSTDDGLVNGACGTITGCRWSSGNSSTAQPDGIELSLTMKTWASRADYMVMRVLSQAPLLFTQ